jgi:biotin carboxyl carrier protein
VKRIIRRGGREGSLEWNGEGDAIAFQLAWDEREAVNGTAGAVEVEPGIYSVLLGDKSYEAKITPSGDAWAVDVDGRHFVLEVEDPRSLRRRGGIEGHTGPQRLASPMPGKVVRVLVEMGAEVEAGQGVAVVEAMKMQNEVKAVRAGRVVSMQAREGATVTAGEVLAVLE